MGPRKTKIRSRCFGHTSPICGDATPWIAFRPECAAVQPQQLSPTAPFSPVRYFRQHVSRRLVYHLNTGEIWEVPDVLRQSAVRHSTISSKLSGFLVSPMRPTARRSRETQASGSLLESHNVIAAVDIDHFAGDAAAGVRGEEDSGRADFCNIDVAAEGGVFGVGFQHIAEA